MDGIAADIEKHLMEDARPSVYFNESAQMPEFGHFPLSMLIRMKQTDQAPKWHPEGNVWNHTMLVTDESAKVKGRSGNARELMWAALLHDIGKPDTTRVRKGKITAYDHEKAGAVLARQFLEAFTHEEEFIRNVVGLVRWHMQILFVVNDMNFADVTEMRKETDIREVALLGLCDRLGRIGADRKAEEENIAKFLRKAALML